MTCLSPQSRRNLSRTRDRAMWQQTKSEKLPLRYRLHYPDGARNVRTGRHGLVAEIRETKPVMIERIFPHDSAQNFANLPAHQFLIQQFEILEVRLG